MTDDVKWNDQPAKFENLAVDGIGHLKLIDGVWVADNGDRYTFIDGELTLTPLQRS